jgi:hypothetical protein
MRALGDYIHALGLKFGIYVTPGIPAIAVYLNRPIEGTPYHAPDIAITTQRHATYLGGTMYYIDYSAPGSQEFINSWANLFASWGVDYLKLDAVGDWSIPDIQAWSAALAQTGRLIHLELSNDLNPASAAVWNQYANGWRMSPDIEAYNGVTLTSWEHVALRFARAPRWLAAGASGGWNDLDSLIVGGTRTGLTHDERQTMATLWALSASPLIVGDDLRTLDAFGIALLTNPEVIGVNQQGVVAAPLNTASERQVWSAVGPDGSYVVGLFNLGSTPATVSAVWNSLGFTGTARVRDLWARSDLGSFTGSFDAQLAPHGSMLLRVAPAWPVQPRLAASGTFGGGAFLGSSPVGARGQRAQYVGFGGALTFAGVNAAYGGWYGVTITYINGDVQPRDALMTVNSRGWPLTFPAAGDWDADTTSQGITFAAYFDPGVNHVTFTNADGWAPDIIGITVQRLFETSPVYYRVISVQTGRVLEDPVLSMEAGVPIIQWPASDGLNQLWHLESNGDGSFHLINAFSGQALDAYHQSTQAGAPLVQWPSDAGPSQTWRPVAAGNGAFVLLNPSNGLLVHASSDWDGAKVDQWFPTGAADEHWIIVPVM